MKVQRETVRALVLSLLMVASVVAMSGATAASTAAQDQPERTPFVTTQTFYYDEGGGNNQSTRLGPQPPNEDAGSFLESLENDNAANPGDNDFVRNPDGNWDPFLVVIEATPSEVTGDLGAPDASGVANQIVTDTFLSTSGYDFTLTQKNGNKQLDVQASADAGAFEVVADPKDNEDGWTDDDDTYGAAIAVWVNPNEAVLSGGSFAPGDNYTATITVNGDTHELNVSAVDGFIRFDNQTGLSPVNTFDQALTGETNIHEQSFGYEGEFLTELANATETTDNWEIQGADSPDGDGAVVDGTVPFEAVYDFTGFGGQDFTTKVNLNGSTVASATGTVRDVVDPDYTMPTANITNAKTLSLPYLIGDHTSPAQIAASTGDGEVSVDTTIARNTQGTHAWDGMWLHFETSSTVLTAIRKAPGTSLIEKFQNSGLSLNVTQINPAPGMEPKKLNLTKSPQSEGAIILIPDQGGSDARLYAGDSIRGLFVWVNLNQVKMVRGDEMVDPKIGEKYRATLSGVTEQEGNVSSSTTFELVAGETNFIGAENGQLNLTASSSVNIQIRSSIAAGTEFGITVRAPNANFSTSDSGWVISGATDTTPPGGVAAADPTGTGGVVFDLSSLSPGTEIVVEVTASEDPPNSPVLLNRITGQIVEKQESTVSMSDQTTRGEAITLDSVNLANGGFVSVHRGSATGPTVGTSQYLAPGEHQDVRIALSSPIDESQDLYVLLHQDSNNNQALDFPQADGPYRVEGSPVSASASVTVEQQTVTRTVVQTQQVEVTRTVVKTRTVVQERTVVKTRTVVQTITKTVQTGGQPGFGIAIAVVALLAAALLAVRRRD